MSRVLIVPASGDGSRFSQQGFTKPKPFISVGKGKQTMIERAITPFLPHVDRVVLILKSDHVENEDGFSEIIHNIQNSSSGEVPVSVCLVNYKTEGAAISVLAACGNISHQDEVVIINSDQFFEGVASEFGLSSWFNSINYDRPDGSLLTFKVGPNDTRWSYVRLDEENRVIEVAEKKPISDIATCGVYYFASWGICMDAICRMVAKNDRFNQEFYLAPAYNHLKRKDHRNVKGVHQELAVPNITITNVTGFWSVGTPELLLEWQEGVNKDDEDEE